MFHDMMCDHLSIKRETITLDRATGESLGFDVCGTVDSDIPGPVRVFVQKIKPGGLADRYVSNTSSVLAITIIFILCVKT